MPYEIAHLDTFEPGYWDMETTMNLRDQEGWEGMAASVVEDGRTLAIFGIGLPRATAMIWAVVSDEMRQRPVALCRMARTCLLGLQVNPNIEIIKVEVDFEFTEARRWAEWLGFKGPNRAPHMNREMIWQQKHI